MIGICEEDSAGRALLLEMTLQAESVVALVQHSLIDGAVWRMADETTLAHRLVFKNKRTALRGVTLEAGVVSGQEGGSTALDRLV